MQQLAQMQQQFQQQYTGGTSSGNNVVMSPQNYSPSRRGRKPTDKKKRKRHTWVKRPTTAYLYFVSKYRETLKEAGEVVPKAKIITQACAEKWRNMNEEEKEPFLELSRRDRERWQKDKALEKKPRDPNRPKRPPSAYFLFLADFRKNYPGKSDPAKEITKKAGEAWNSLSDAEKTPYYRSAQLVRAKWEQDLEAYKQSVKCGTLSRASSIQSDHDPVEMVGEVGLDEDESPMSSPTQTGNPIAQMGANLLQGGSSSMISGVASGSGVIPSTTPESPTTGNSLQAAPVSYAYPHHMVAPQTSGLQQQFPGR
nr:transcription factor protein [Ciona intestinalis]BAE06615.1 transcription factor protein [Ciona intestinalis]|eukprot:NP_001071792.1 transcription factor protein [Ciona intestinalis]